MSRFELNSSVKKPFRGESLLENQKINWEGLILDQKIEISELQPRINLLFNGLCKVKCRLTRKAQMLKRGNPDHPEIGKSEINQKPKAILTVRDSCIRLGILFDVETRKR